MQRTGSKLSLLAATACSVALVPAAGAEAKPTPLKPLLAPLLNPLQAVDRGLLDLDGDRAGLLEELLLESCNPLTARDTDGGGIADGVEIDRGLDCLNPADDKEVPTDDRDGDGFPVPEDCDDHDAAIHPNQPDPADVKAIDLDCDGFDGDPDDGIFVTPTGDDGAAGTREAPLRNVQNAVDLASATGKDVYIDSAVYSADTAGVILRDGVNLYGGYRAEDGWSRIALTSATRIEGSPQAALAQDGVAAELQLLELRATPDASTRSVYGLRVVHETGTDAAITLRKVRVRAADAVAGTRGAHGADGADGNPGQAGGPGDEDGDRGSGGNGGTSPLNYGGRGGSGGHEDQDGNFGAPGEGPFGGNPGRGGFEHGCDGGEDGVPGQDGGAGSSGSQGAGGTNSLAEARFTFVADLAEPGGNGTDGSGGGGGGGGAGQGGAACVDGGGAGGGGGGAGGFGAFGAGAGTPGGGSFGIYLYNARVRVLDGSSVVAGDGGPGGDGGRGGVPGTGGAGGVGGSVTDDGVGTPDGEVGKGGKGGKGGDGGRGGHGGGGAGGPSAAIGQFGSAGSEVVGSTLQHGDGGPGGDGPRGPDHDGQSGLSGDLLP
ncbi:hypothetical protein [Patulibacter defluvii]|uniref:hypothetical protein n=1 Tax=Patulibacter defluvii TaxID=3095358 RepID=UPI002A7634AD|nr:hypothetical protein [Patulibacter sp. DM4]